MKEKNILIVDDNKDICNMIKEYLENYNYHVEICTDANKGLKKILENHFDLIILDIMMEYLDGIKICKISREKVECPIIFLSAKNFEEDKVNALSVGGDDYITKPFSLKELLARVKSHLRRQERIKNKKNYVISSNNIIIDITAKEVFCKGQKLNLRKKEYNLIEFFILNKNIVFSKEQIFEKVWGDDSESYLETVTESIKNIRKKIKKFDQDNSYITTYYGMGYKWEIKNAR